MTAAKRKQQTARKLNETSWLAQTIKDKMTVEFDKNRNSGKYNSLNTLYVIVQEADDPENEKIYYTNYRGKRQIVICDIPSLSKHGMDFTQEGMRSKLLGLAERYKDDDGMYIVDVKITHDLNSASINDIHGLLMAMAA
jgi:hypothetical protein